MLDFQIEQISPDIDLGIPQQDTYELLSLVHEYDEVLHKEAEPFNFSEPQVDIMRLVKNMVHTLEFHGGFGLAAPQIGLPLRVFVLKSDPWLAMVNPKIVSTLRSEEEVADESCLSYPGIVLPVKRASAIRVRYTQPNGQTKTDRFEGLTARVIQHEVDHLDGITILNRVNRYHRDKAMKRRKQILGGKSIDKIRNKL